MTDVTPESTTQHATPLEDEGEIAADYLEELLDIADLDGDIDIDVRHGRAAVEIVAEDQRSINHLVGKDGVVLEALQDLTRLAVQARTGERSRLMLDVAASGRPVAPSSPRSRLHRGAGQGIGRGGLHGSAERVRAQGGA